MKERFKGFMRKEVKVISEKNHRDNEVVRCSNVSKYYDIEENMTLAKACEIAEEYGEDVMFVAEDTDIPIVKIVNYDKLMYDKSKAKKNSKKSGSKTKGEKEVRLSYKISENDLRIKMKKVGQIVEEGYSAKIKVVFKGREITMINRGKELLDNAIGMVRESASIKVRKDVYREGNALALVVGK